MIQRIPHQMEGNSLSPTCTLNFSTNLFFSLEIEYRRYTTNLKSIIPLPDIKDKARTFPEHDYLAGLHVMALYPDTTAFYRAQIMSGPELIVEKGKVRTFV